MPKLKVMIDNEKYHKSNRFNKEKRYDYPRNYVRNVGIFSEFNKEHPECIEINQEYEKSDLYVAHGIINRNEYSEKEKAKVKNNTLDVDVRIKNGKKEKSFKQTKITDELASYFGKKSSLKYYNKHLSDYKNIRDRASGKIFDVEIGRNYKSPKEYENVRKLLKNTRSAIQLMESSDLESKEQKLSENWLDFLRENIAVNGVYEEYGVVFGKYIEDLPKFDEKELEKIDKFSKAFNENLKRVLEDEELEISL